MKKYYKWLGVVVGIFLLTPIDDIIFGKLLFPRASIVQVVGFGLIIFFGYKIIKNHRGE